MEYYKKYDPMLTYKEWGLAALMATGIIMIVIPTLWITAAIGQLFI